MKRPTTSATTASNGKLTSTDISAVHQALGTLQNKNFVPKFTLPDIKARVPNGALVERRELTPSGVHNARKLFDELKSDIPVLLFPVRLETRFTASKTQLRIRIFPDQASIDSLDPRLTEEELAAGKAFLAELKQAPDQAAKREAWHSFATAYAPRRAAHIVHSIRAGGAAKSLRKSGESHRALAPLLPDHWFVTGYANSQVVFDKVSRPVSRNIAFSPDLEKIPDVSNDIAIDPAIRWMLDYNEALECGMAVTVNLPPLARDKIDEIYVLGVRTSDPTARDGKLTPRKAAIKLNDLLASHLHDWGAGFVAPATATNNTSDVESGWSDTSVDLDDMFTRLIDEPADAPAIANPALAASLDETMTPTGTLDAGNTSEDAADKSEETNHARLAKVLGLDPNSNLKKLENRTGSEDAVQAAMNTLLWPVTWGEMLGPLLKGREESYLTKETVDWLRDWFISSVRGGAPLPTLRLGRTPYGVLPVSKTHLSRELHLTDTEAKRRQMLSVYLRRLLPYWEDGADDVLRMGLWESPLAQQFADPGDRFLQILRQQPHPAKYSLSEAVSERSLYDLRYEIRNLIVHPVHDSQLLQKVFADIKVRISYSVPMPGKIKGPKVEGWVKAAAPGKAAFENWPEHFTNGSHQRQVLAEKRQLLLDILDPRSSLYNNLTARVGGISIDISTSAAEAMKSRKDEIESMTDWLQEMIDICDEHLKVNASFDTTFDPPTDLYNGIVGLDSDDPHLSFLASDDSDLGEWNSDAHVVVQKGGQTVTFGAQVDYLLGYAQSFISSTAAPEEPEFTGGKKPLLFRLLKDAIYRTGVDEETTTAPIFEMAEVTTQPDVSATRKQREIGIIVGSMEKRQITDITASIKSISTIKGKARVKVKDEHIARTLRGTSPKVMNDLAANIDREIANKRKDTSFPANEMKALSAELKTLARAGGGKLRDMTFSRAPNPRRTKINQMKNALNLLRDLNPQQIDLLMSQTMGLASWRLDAWLTSLPLRRIADLRDGNKRNGIQIGAFGWVQNLQPNNRQAADGNRIDSQGYIHTPSLNHAKTAAILRAGWTNYGSDEATSALAVDLSSSRMREAHWIFNAVRQGQDLGDVLGYRFERYLKDTARAAHWIYPIRQAVLSMTGQPLDPEQPGVDGLELNRIASTSKKHQLKLKASELLKELGGDDKLDTFSKVEGALDYLSDQVDALADAAIADSVHALAQGNLLRSGSSLSAISDGEVPPPELDILKTTPTAQTQTHRVALMAPLNNNKRHAWVADPSDYPSAAADPDAEALVAALLGPASQLQITVTYCDETGKSIKQHDFNWARMLAEKSPFAAPALKTLMLLPAAGLTENCDLVQRVLAHASAFPARGVPGGSAVRFDREAQDWAMLDPLIDRWLGWRAVVLDARPMAPRDILIGEAEEAIEMHIANLEQRASDALLALKEQAKRVLDALPEPVEGNETPIGKVPPETLLSAFDALARLGVESAVFRLATGVIDTRSCYEHAWRLAPTLRKQLKTPAIISADSEAMPEARIKAARKVLRHVFGVKFPGLCRLKSNHLPTIGKSLTQSARRAKKTTGGTPAQWIEKLGYVRPAMRALNDAMLVQDCQPGSPGGVILKVAQWPEDRVQPWIAVDASVSENPPKTSLVAASVAGSAQIQDQITGLIVDEMVDRVPARQVNTGVALHFDAPNTEAPQTLLLALPPEGEKWNYANMIDTVRDAFQLARIRAVDDHQMEDMHQFLPAIYASKSTGSGGKP